MSHPSDGANPHASELAAKEREAAEVDGLRADAVAEEAGERRRDPDGEHVDRQHPLRRGETRAEGRAERREGDVDDGRVEQDHEEPEDDRDEDLPSPRHPSTQVGGVGGGGGNVHVEAAAEGGGAKLRGHTLPLSGPEGLPA